MSEPTVDVEVLWELLQEGGGRFALADLAELALGDSSTRAQDAVQQAVEADRIRFRCRKGLYEPRAAASVEESLHQQRLKEARDASRVALRKVVDDALSRGVAAPDLSPWEEDIRLLEELAVHGPDHPRAGAAEELLRELGRARSAPMQKTTFKLLVRLGVFSADENLLVRRHRVPVAFPAAVWQEAERLADGPDPVADPGRLDRTDVLTLAIDDTDTLEIDDALSVSPREGGGWCVEVHVADAAAWVPLGSAVHAEAARRGATLYLPDRKVTMLPQALAFDRASLTQGNPRAAITFRIDMTDGGDVIGFEPAETRIVVDRCMSYDEANALLDSAMEGYGAALRTLEDLSQASRERRLAAGAFDLQPTEVKVRVDDAGEVEVTAIDRAARSRRLVAEWMILTGHLFARWAETNGIPAVYRSQEGPIQPIEVPDEAAADAATFHRVVRNMRRATLSSRPGRHAGLGVSPYAQVTSPLRRYTDLTLHHQAKAWLRGEHPPIDEEALMTSVAAAEEAADVLGRIEKETARYFLLKHLAGRKGEIVRGTVLADRPRGRFLIELDGLGLQAITKLSGPRTPGDVVRLRVKGASPREDRIELVEVREGDVGQDPSSSESEG